MKLFSDDPLALKNEVFMMGSDVQFISPNKPSGISFAAVLERKFFA